MPAFGGWQLSPWPMRFCPANISLDHLDHLDHLDSAFWIGMDVKLETTSSAYIGFLMFSLCIHCIDDWCMNFWFCHNKLVMLPFTNKFCIVLPCQGSNKLWPKLILAWTEPKARMPQATAMMGPPLVVAGLVRLPSRQKGSFDSYLDSCTVLVISWNFL